MRFPICLFLSTVTYLAVLHWNPWSESLNTKPAESSRGRAIVLLPEPAQRDQEVAQPATAPDEPIPDAAQLSEHGSFRVRPTVERVATGGPEIAPGETDAAHASRDQGSDSIRAARHSSPAPEHELPPDPSPRRQSQQQASVTFLDLPDNRDELYDEQEDGSPGNDLTAPEPASDEEEAQDAMDPTADESTDETVDESRRFAEPSDVDNTEPGGGGAVAADYERPNLDAIYQGLPEDLQQLPDLIIQLQGTLDWRAVDESFGIKTVAYTIDDANAPTFVAWDEHGVPTLTDAIERATYSNRCRDRNHVPLFRNRLAQARKRFGLLSRPLRIVGLVPSDVDRQFAAIQLDAIQRAGVAARDVKSTTGKYIETAPGRYRLIVEEINLINQ
ncbi:MAG: hypothetical protein ACYTHJ_06675 [Planctomycetota bacterium]|jgi:hypothetical protein